MRIRKDDRIITEACFHLGTEAQRLRLRALLARLDVAPVPVRADGQFRNDVFEWLLKYAEHEPDWTDGCLAVLCGRDAAARVWTYDREFTTTWRRPDGARIPLAVT